jgi:hypothetical protein
MPAEKIADAADRGVDEVVRIAPVEARLEHA